MLPSVWFSLLGRFQLTINGSSMEPLLTVRLQSAVCCLALAHPASVPRRQLAALLWPATPETQALTNLRNVLHKLRHELPIFGRAVADSEGSLVWTSQADVHVDVNDFEAACRASDADRAIALYTGDLLPDCYDEWVLIKRNQLQNLFLTALEHRTARLTQGGRYAAAVHDVRRHLGVDPLREDVHRALMRLLARQGDRAGALHAYRTLEQLLQRELGVDCSPATRRLHADLLRDDSSLFGADWIPDGLFA